MALPTADRARFLQGLVAENPETVSEDTARAIDREVKQLMTEAHDRAVQILREHRQVIDAVVRLLLDREVVEGDEVRRLLDAERAPALRASA